ncbi:MAG: ATP phosphoribosyltransferase regulatory subunit [Armatimonadota bacterium]|nr:ATP phosphoribosyltransferase regulatory subunit [Armatimonadota bacterium]MDR7402995.1 ATP phosphoribosyltransferase regulatory subunit [Armatimonadota bacterium]
MRVRDARSTRWQRVPDGYRDLPPPDAARRAELAGRLRRLCEGWGYREVSTPALEFLDTFQHGAGPGIQDQIIKIVDGAELLALRPEMTVPIARLAATRLLPERGLPLRLSYVAPVYRVQEPGRGRMREFTQAGVELLGLPGADGDAEVIALAVACLREVGLSDAVVHVGHLGFLAEALGGLAPAQQDEVRARLYRRDYVAVAEVAGGAAARLLHALPDLHGADALRRARPLAASPAARAALDELAEILDLLQAYGAADAVEVDLGIVRDFSYYTGVVFEALGRGTPVPVLGGGRYDGLLARFGADCPASGFALGLEVAMSLLPPSPPARCDVLVLADRATRQRAAALAAGLRRAGLQVVVAPAMSGPQARALAAREGAAMLAWWEGEDLWVEDVATGRQDRSTARWLTGAARARAGEVGTPWGH